MDRPVHVPTHAVRYAAATIAKNVWITATGGETDSDPVGVIKYYVGSFRREFAVLIRFDHVLEPHGTWLDVLVRNGPCELGTLALQEHTSLAWLDAVVPHLLDRSEIDSMTKLRLAARWAEATT